MSVYSKRRSRLIDTIQCTYDIYTGYIILIASIHTDHRTKFVQDASFYYMTGFCEPGAIAVINLSDRTTTLYMPNIGSQQGVWHTQADTTEFDAVQLLGSDIQGYCINYQSPIKSYEHLLSLIKQQIKSKIPLFTLTNSKRQFQQLFIIERWQKHFDCIIPFRDISLQLAHMRSVKDEYELSCIKKAISITDQAFHILKTATRPGLYEYELQALVEGCFINNKAYRAYPSIIASGASSTVLHYTDNNKQLSQDEVLLVDIGACYEYYCADISRTFAINGIFNKQQQKLYDIVFEAQKFLASFAKPGVWLCNPHYPELSLYHQALTFLDKYGYKELFMHGIGHHLGLEVHDAADYTQPLEVGNVITLEPGIYHRSAAIGIRLEDNYLITPNGAECLSRIIK